jgi:hypothetical protein
MERREVRVTQIRRKPWVDSKERSKIKCKEEKEVVG